jgi:hypothetical protein
MGIEKKTVKDYQLLCHEAEKGQTKSGMVNMTTGEGIPTSVFLPNCNIILGNW